MQMGCVRPRACSAHHDGQMSLANVPEDEKDKPVCFHDGSPCRYMRHAAISERKVEVREACREVPFAPAPQDQAHGRDEVDEEAPQQTSDVFRCGGGSTSASCEKNVLRQSLTQPMRQTKLCRHLASNRRSLALRHKSPNCAHCEEGEMHVSQNQHSSSPQSRHTHPLEARAHAPRARLMNSTHVNVMSPPAWGRCPPCSCPSVA